MVVGEFSSTSSADYLEFAAVSDVMRDSHAFGFLISPVSKVTLYKKFDDGKAVLTKFPFTKESIILFVNSESIPLVGEIGPDNYGMYTERGLPIGYFFYETPEQKASFAKMLTSLAKTFKSEISMVYIDAIKFGGHGASMNLVEYPGFVIQNTQLSTKFPFFGDLSEKSISQHIKGVLDGSIEASVKSAAIPKLNDEPVYIVVNKNYNDVVKNTKKDVFIELYAPW